jgi:hypothetical protein
MKKRAFDFFKITVYIFEASSVLTFYTIGCVKLALLSSFFKVVDLV